MDGDDLVDDRGGVNDEDLNFLYDDVLQVIDSHVLNFMNVGGNRNAAMFSKFYTDDTDGITFKNLIFDVVDEVYFALTQRPEVARWTDVNKKAYLDTWVSLNASLLFLGEA